MATGKALSRQRNKERQERDKSLSKADSQPTTVSSSLNNAQLGGASGVGFETAETQKEISRVIKKEIKAGGSKSSAGSSFSAVAEREARLKLAKQEAKDRKERRGSLREGGRLATDNLRASNVNQVQDEAITTQGPRSTPSGRDERQRTGFGTLENPLTDIQIEDLESQGIKEGDLVPGKGFLTPLGTFQSESERQAELLSRQAEDLAKNDITPTDGISVSDEPIVNEEKGAVDTINESAKVIRDLTYLDDEISRIQDELKNEIEAINAQAKVAKTDLQGQQASETGQTSVGLANAGGYLGFSGSATGVLLNLAKSHRAELQSLDAERQQAIFEAQDAARNNEFDLVRLKAQELKDIEQEEYNRKQDYLAETRKTNEKEAAKKEKAKTENDIFTAIQGGAKTTADIFSKLGGEVDAKTINDFLENITPESAEGFKFSATQNASLIGSGLRMDDIRALSEYVNENGYDDKVRSNLSSTQKVALDKIFLPVQKITGSTASSKPMTILDLDRLEESYGVRFPFGVTQGEVTEFFADNPGLDGEEMQNLINEYLGGSNQGGSEQKIQVNKEWLTSNLDINQQKKLADLVGASSWFSGKETDINNMYNDAGLMQSLSNKIQELRDQGFSDDDIISALTQ